MFKLQRFSRLVSQASCNTQTDRQTKYCNPRCACAPRVNNISDHLNSIAAVVKLMVALNTANVCTGHLDLYLCSFIDAKHNKLTCKNGNVVAYLNTTCCVTLNGETYQQTIRTASCMPASSSWSKMWSICRVQKLLESSTQSMTEMEKSITLNTYSTW